MASAARLSALAVVVIAACPVPGWSFDFAGTKHVVAHTRDGTDVAIGTVAFTPNGSGYGYKLDMDMKPFKEFFLSMRPFKCLDGADVWCYVPYPYDHPHAVTAKDLSWLEHDLLFFWKTPTSYGAKMDNGLIYGFHAVGDALVGKPQAISLDKIASPPSDPKVPPYAAADRDDVGDGSRWIESLRIE